MSLAFSSSDMGSVCAEQQHKFHPSHQLYLHKKSLREIDIPPRKLLSRHTSAAAASDMLIMESPKAEDTLLQRFLPYNNVDDDDDDADPYSADQFRMYEFKVRKCTRSRSHDWTDCPFAHPGEKARRRDPRRYHYTGTVCPEFRRGNCSRGDNCEFAHGVFECWLHPSRYRTEACKDGKNCKRKVCFFAHTPRQLRILPVNGNENVSSPSGAEKMSRHQHHCCVYCQSVTTASPTSTLMGMSHFSPPLSPPHSPRMKFSPVSRFGDRFESIDSCGLSQFNPGGMTYEDAALTELISSVEAMNVNKASPHATTSNKGNNLPWVDVNFNVDDQPQFVLSPSTPSPVSRRPSSSFANRYLVEDNKYNDNGLAGPDLGWVNDLLT